MTPDPQPRRHPLNHRFVWANHRDPLGFLTPQQAEAYDEQGFVLVEDAFPPDEIAAVTAEIDPREAKVEAMLRKAEDGRIFIARAEEITFTTHLAAKSEALKRFVSGPVFRGLAGDLIGPDVRLYWDQAVYKKPGTEAPFPWHQDNGYAYVEPQQYLTCWLALTDATEDNGCPWVVPGLHRSGTLQHWSTDLGYVCLEDAPGAVPVTARAGSIVVFSSLTPHCTGPNRTAHVRKAYIVQFAPDGATVIDQTEASGSLVRTPANAGDRQFPILVAGSSPN